jgi:hypothetical protein
MALVSPTRSTDTAAQEPLLSYELTTDSDPLHASPENTAVPEETGELIIVGSRRSGTPADVQWIKVKVPSGTMSPDLATDLSKVTPRISLNGWTVQLNSSTKEFVFTPAASHTPIGPETGFTIQLSDIPISRKVGTAPITVTESSRTGASAFAPRSVIFNVGKFPADFYLRNFIANPLVIENGGETTLTWERSANATYELLYGETSLDVTSQSTRTITNIRTHTTFYLRGTTGDPSNPVTRILTAQVTVIKPDLEVGQLIVNGTITAKGDVNIAKEKKLTLNNLAPADGVKISVGADLAVADGKALTANHIRATTNTAHPVVFQGALTVTGNVLAKSHMTVTEAGSVLRVRELRGPVKQEGESSDPPIDISRGTIKVGTIHGTGTYPTVSIPAHLSLSTAGRTTTIHGNVAFGTALFASPTRKNYAKVSTKPRSTSKWSMTATKNGLLVVEAASFEWFTDDEKHGRKHRVYVEGPGITYYFDLVAHGKKTRQSSQGVWDNVTVPLSKGATAKVWIDDIDDVASANECVQMNICWYAIGS